MQYQSIIRLFEFCGIDYKADSTDTKRIKKILSAEFSITSEGLISVNGFDYSKNDLFNEIDRDDFQERLHFHRIIWENESLLDCLEKNEAYFSDLHTWMGLKDDSGFVRFVSPYFARTFDKVMSKILNIPDLNDARRWLGLLVFIDNPDDEYKSLNSVRSYLADMTKSLRNVNDSNYRSIIHLVDPWIDQSGASFLNQLPSSLYKDKDSLIRAWIDFTCVIDKKDTNLCYQVSCQLKMLTEIDPELYKIIHDNHSIFDRKTSSSSSFTGCALYFFVFFVVLFFVGILKDTGNNKTSLKIDPKYVLKAYESVTPEFFNDVRSRNSFISTDTFCILDKNADEELTKHHLYYIMVERPDTCKSIKINVKNKSDHTYIVHFQEYENNVSDAIMKTNECISIEVNKPAFDFAVEMENTDYLIPGMSKAVYVADNMEFSDHYVNFDWKERSINHSLGTKSNDSTGITMEIYSRTFSQPNFVIQRDYFKFEGSNWIVSWK